MKSSHLRTITALLVIVGVTIGFVTNYGIGTLSAIGWQDLVLLCPLGALGTMLATKTMIPQAIISLIIAVVAIILIGRAFCAWLCPVPITQKLRELFRKPEPKRETESVTCSDKSCTSCAAQRDKLDSRHFILGGSLLSAAIFGFPVFCIICPIGLSFAGILLVIRLFTFGDVTWSIIAVPTLLIIEILLFKKWCGSICPLAAFMSLVGKLNRTFRPRIDDATCKESSKGLSCGACAKSCPEGIDPRHPQLGNAWSECTKCRECVEACPTKAIRMPFLPKRNYNDPEQKAVYHNIEDEPPFA
jgi:ferredoxin-type protein NapH